MRRLICFVLPTADVVFSRHPNESDSDTGSPGNILTCVASSIPIPEIKWFRVQNQFSVQLTNRSQSLIHTEIDGCAVTSTLQLAPITNFRSVTGFFCNGNNGFFQRDSYVVETSNSEHHTLSPVLYEHTPMC